jgi:hypothetical protein
VRHAALLVIAALALGVAGCRFPFTRPEPVQHELLSFRTTPQAADLKRVAVLPFYLADGVGRSATAINESMPSALRELGLHEVLSVSVNQRDLLLPDDPLLANHITTDQLLKLRDNLHCDGVLLGRIEQFDSFDPISMGVSAHLVSCLDGSIPWSAIGHFDGRRQDVQQDIERWYERTNGDGSGNLSGWRLVLASPRLFTRYVAERMALSIPIPPAK